MNLRPPYHASISYKLNIRKAIERRNAAREPGITDRLRRFRLNSMRFWSTTAIVVARTGKIPLGPPNGLV